MCALIGLAVSGCGSGSGNQLSSHDKATLAQIDSLVTQYIRLDHEIAADTVAGSKIHTQTAYFRIDGPRIDQLNQKAQTIRKDARSFDDATAARLYEPLAASLDREASDLEMLLHGLKTGNLRSARAAYTRVGNDERHIRTVAAQQLPRVRAYAQKISG
jgi:hypothetical protein